MAKLPSGLANAVARLHTGTPGARPFSPTPLPSLSKSCHATEPPLAQPVPSVQTKSVSPFAFAAATGCLRLVPVSGDTGRNPANVFGVTLAKNTLSPVSHAANTPVFPSVREALLVGQLVAFQGWL